MITDSSTGVCHSRRGVDYCVAAWNRAILRCEFVHGDATVRAFTGMTEVMG